MSGEGWLPEPRVTNTWPPILAAAAEARTRREHIEVAERLMAEITTNDAFNFNLIAATMALTHATLANSEQVVADRQG